MNEENRNHYLLKKIAVGELSAIEEIYSSCADIMIRYGKKITCDTQLVEDTIHDIFLDLIKNRKEISSVNNLQAYLLRATRNNLLRKMKEQKKMSSGLSAVDDCVFSYDIDRSELDDEQNRIATLLSRLSGLEREIVYLRFFENLSNSRICDVLSLKNQTVKNVVSSAMKKMRCFITYEQTVK